MTTTLKATTTLLFAAAIGFSCSSDDQSKRQALKGDASEGTAGKTVTIALGTEPNDNGFALVEYVFDFNRFYDLERSRIYAWCQGGGDQTQTIELIQAATVTTTVLPNLAVNSLTISNACDDPHVRVEELRARYKEAINVPVTYQICDTLPGSVGGGTGVEAAWSGVCNAASWADVATWGNLSNPPEISVGNSKLTLTHSNFAVNKVLPLAAATYTVSESGIRTEDDGNRTVETAPQPGSITFDAKDNKLTRGVLYDSTSEDKIVWRILDPRDDDRYAAPSSDYAQYGIQHMGGAPVAGSSCTGANSAAANSNGAPTGVTLATSQGAGGVDDLLLEMDFSAVLPSEVGTTADPEYYCLEVYWNPPGEDEARISFIVSLAAGAADLEFP